MKPYLYALEVHDMNIGTEYDMLPVHCTLIHWFELEAVREHEMQRRVQAVASQVGTIALSAQSQETFTGRTKNGPIPVTVDTVVYTPELRALHEGVCDVLDDIGAYYSNPAYVRDTYVPHVTHQATGSLQANVTHESTSLYLITADAAAYGNQRTVIDKIALAKE